MGASVARLLRRPAAYGALVAAIVLLGIVVRLARVPDATDVFTGIPDGKQYVVQAYGLYIHGFFEPFAHRADGWPLLLAGALRLFGFVGTSGFTMGMSAPFDQEGWDALRFSYAFHAIVAAALVPATLVLARQMVGPLTSAAAALLVAIDPFLLSESTTVMADQLFAVLVVLAFAAVLCARRHPAWLGVAGGLAALSHMARVNGLLILAALMVFAAVWMRRAGSRRRAWHLAVPVVVFFVVAAPYLAWRAQYLPGPFDYGTNQRFWTDDPWNMSDDYWRHYSYSGGGPRETAADYFATHTLGEAAERLYHSVQWQVLDLTTVTIAPLLLVLAVVGMAAGRKETWAGMTPILALFLLATFTWIYPVVRSPRYFLVLIPFCAILAAYGAQRVAAATERATLAAIAILAAYLATYGVEPIVRAPRAWVLVHDAHVLPMVVIATTIMILAAAMPGVLSALRRGLRREAPPPTSEP